MDYGMIKTAADKLHMSSQMKQRIVRNCKAEISPKMEEKAMNQNKNWRKPAAVLAALAICLTLSVTALAATGVMDGFFRDITDYRGAVVGISYEQATDEINMSASVNGNELTVRATFSIPQESPYREAENLGIAAYRIVDAGGKVVKEGAGEPVKVSNGQAAILIPMEGVDSGDYKLIVTAFVTEKKADQPLNLNGYWECDFTK